MRRLRSGVLSTHSLKHTGYPYGSALPHVTDQAGRPVVLISHLAEHTHNIEADPRVSFTVCGSGPDLQAEPRATLLGDARSVEDDGQIERRYLRFYPAHQPYLQIGGFRFYAIAPKQVRYIQGFGGLHWIPGESYLTAAALAESEVAILEHMNADHRAALRDYCRHVHDVAADEPEMVGIDSDGFDVRAGDRLLRFDFDMPVDSPGQVRNALVELAKRCR